MCETRNTIHMFDMVVVATLSFEMVGRFQANTHSSKNLKYH